MSITVNDCLNLPCLKDARVVGGHKGLNRIVSSISVLEYANPESLQEELFSNSEFYGSELVISAFTSVKDDIEAQCANIERLAAVGEVGLILYYVGIFLPKIDKSLIALANELDFPIIVMPENRFNLRYSEVIVEVMEAIIADRSRNNYFVSEILERISKLKKAQRTMDNVLRMISDRIHSTILLTDENNKILNIAVWPRGYEDDFSTIFENFDKKSTSSASYIIDFDGTSMYICTSELTIEDGHKVKFHIAKDNDYETSDFVRQTKEILRISLNLFSQNHSTVVLSELVRAILDDEPMNMRRLATFFNINVSEFNSLWVLKPNNQNKDVAIDSVISSTIEFLDTYSNTLVVDQYNNSVVIFMDKKSIAVGNAALYSSELIKLLKMQGHYYDLVICNQLITTKDVRSAYLVIDAHLSSAKIIFPSKSILTAEDLIFSHSCEKIIEAGESSLERKLAPLIYLISHSNLSGFDVESTLSTYMLDCQQNVGLSADTLFLHKNTMKYRLQQITEKLGHSIKKMPESYNLYQACAIHRLLENSKKN